MAQIDIRNATILIKDGYSGPAGSHTVNAPAYAIGTASLAIDNFVGAVATNNKLMIAGDTTIYNISSHSETLGNTTLVGLGSVLGTAAADNAVVTIYQPNADLAAVNNGAGYSIGQSVITVGSFVGVIAVGNIVMFAGHATPYRVTAHTETLGNTTQVTVSPNLTSAIVDTEVVTVYQPNADTALINHPYAIGVSTILVSGFTGEVVDFDFFSIAGDDTVYMITSHIETLGNTTSLTFTPALVATATLGAALTILPHQLEITIGDGNLTYDEKRTIKYIRDRGNLDTVREDMDEPIDVSLDATWEFLRSPTGDPPTIEDALKNRGQAAGWISSSSDLCEPYAVDVVIMYMPPCSGEEDEIITLPDFRWESFSHDLKQGTLAVKGKCNAKEAIVVRS